MAVVAARELDHPVAPGHGAREPQRAHRRLGAGADEPHHLDRGNRVDDLGRELDLGLGRGAERRAAVRGGVDRCERLGIGVAEDQGPPGLHPVDVLGAGGVLDDGTLAAAP